MLPELESKILNVLPTSACLGCLQTPFSHHVEAVVQKYFTSACCLGPEVFHCCRVGSDHESAHPLLNLTGEVSCVDRNTVGGQ